MKPTNSASLQMRADAALARGDYVALDALTRAWIVEAPHAEEPLFLAGVAALEQRRLALAIERLEAARVLGPARADIAAQLARALSLAQRLPEALTTAQAALALPDASAGTLDTLGVVLSRANAHADAADAFERAAALAPRDAAVRFNLASAKKFTGDFDAAEAAYEACIARAPRFWKAHSALSQLRRQRADRNHIARLQSLLPTAAGDADALLHLHLALAKEYEDLGQFDTAFTHYRDGKAARRATLAYTPTRDAALTDAIIAAANLPDLRDGDPTHEPIFVIGMPRTGTTLVERILSSHPQVHAAGELQNFGVAVKRLSGSRTPLLLDADTLARGVNIDPRALGAAYLASTRPATGHTARFVDKLPQNFLYAGLIARALPNAKIVCLRRHPLDTCLSNFRQLFALNSPYFDYAYDLLGTGRYYLGFDRLMMHWRHTLPGRILELDYESLVDNQHASTRKLLEFCDLPWDDACLHFETNTAPTATASAVQVRAPIHRDARHRWRAYAPHLRELRALLEDNGIAVAE